MASDFQRFIKINKKAKLWFKPDAIRSIEVMTKGQNDKKHKKFKNSSKSAKFVILFFKKWTIIAISFLLGLFEMMYLSKRYNFWLEPL